MHLDVAVGVIKSLFFSKFMSYEITRGFYFSSLEHSGMLKNIEVRKLYILSQAIDQLARDV